MEERSQTFWSSHVQKRKTFQQRNGGGVSNEGVDSIRVKEFDEIIKYLLRGSHPSKASMYDLHWWAKSDYSEGVWKRTVLNSSDVLLKALNRPFAAKAESDADIVAPVPTLE
jgi:hypothetical protein